jgi:hypothetical protein
MPAMDQSMQIPAEWLREAGVQSFAPAMMAVPA